MKLADAFTVESEIINDSSIKILSIGRFSYAKRFDEVPCICKKLRETGLDVKWYLIGYGGDKALIQKKIQETNMQNYVIILGKKENPYPYIKACDFYIQPSRYEGKSIAVREAQLLGKPVIITNYFTAHSQLKDGYDGIIVPMELDECAACIGNVISNKKLIQQIQNNLIGNSIALKNEVEKLYKIINSSVFSQ